MIHILHYEKFVDESVKCIEEEIPFELPQGWEWCRLKHICIMAAGKSKPTEQNYLKDVIRILVVTSSKDM